MTDPSRPQRRRISGRSAPAGTPRWVYAFGIAFVVAIALFVIVHLTGIMPMHGRP